MNTEIIKNRWGTNISEKNNNIWEILNFITLTSKLITWTIKNDETYRLWKKYIEILEHYEKENLWQNSWHIFVFINDIKISIKKLIDSIEIKPKELWYDICQSNWNYESWLKKEKTDEKYEIIINEKYYDIVKEICETIDKKFSPFDNVFKNKQCWIEIFVFQLPSFWISISFSNALNFSTIITPTENFEDIVTTMNRTEIRDQSKINPLLGHLERNKLSIEEWKEELIKIINKISSNINNNPEFEIKKIWEIDWQNDDDLRNIINWFQNLINEDNNSFINLHLQEFDSKDWLLKKTWNQIWTWVFWKYDSWKIQSEILSRRLYPFLTDDWIFNPLNKNHLLKIFPNIQSLINDWIWLHYRNITRSLWNIKISLNLIVKIIFWDSYWLNEHSLIIAEYLFWKDELIKNIKDSKINKKNYRDKEYSEKALRNKVFDFINNEQLMELFNNWKIIKYDWVKKEIEWKKNPKIILDEIELNWTIFNTKEKINPEDIIELKEKNWKFNLLYLARQIFDNQNYNWNENTINELKTFIEKNWQNIF